MNWYLDAFRQYATFSGRARRKAYWYFMLFYYLVFILTLIVDLLLIKLINFPLFLNIIYFFITFIPLIAITTRRLHDTNRSGWWQLVVFVPVIGLIVPLVFFFLKGTKGPNRFGNDPLESEKILETAQPTKLVE